MESGTNGQLGWVVSWRVPTEVDIGQVRAAVAAAGMDPDAMAGDLKPRVALRRALHDMRRGRVITRLRQTGADLHFQLTAELVGQYEATYQREAEVCLDTETGALTGDEPVLVEQARRLIDEHLAKRLTGDLTRMIQGMFDAHKAALVPIREQGGAYFVPREHEVLVNAARVVLEGIGGQLRSFAVRMGCDDTADSVADSMAEYLSGMIREFRESCDGVTGDSRPSVKRRRMVRVGEIREQLHTYRGLLRGFSDRIGEELQRSERDLLAALAHSADGSACTGTHTDRSVAMAA